MEIKARAWNLNDKCWVDSDNFAICPDDGTIMIYEPSEDRYFPPGFKYVVMFFTGLKDKNGVKIFEGDILEYWCQNFRTRNVVKFENGSFWMDNNTIPYAIQYGAEVIGNISENPDMVPDAS